MWPPPGPHYPFPLKSHHELDFKTGLPTPWSELGLGNCNTTDFVKASGPLQTYVQWCIRCNLCLPSCQLINHWFRVKIASHLPKDNEHELIWYCQAVYIASKQLTLSDIYIFKDVLAWVNVYVVAEYTYGCRNSRKIKILS